MERGRLLKFGGLAAGVILILFGIGSLWLSIDSRMTVEDELSAEHIVGSPDMSPEGIAPAIDEAGLEGVTIPDCDVAGEAIDNGDEARCFAQYMRIHALESSGGLTYAEMGRFVSADDPSNPAGTSDEAAAQKDAARQSGRQRRPQHMGDRDRPLDRAQHVLHGLADLALWHRRRDRAHTHRDRALDPRARRLQQTRPGHSVVVTSIDPGSPPRRGRRAQRPKSADRTQFCAQERQ